MFRNNVFNRLRIFNKLRVFNIHKVPKPFTTITKSYSKNDFQRDFYLTNPSALEYIKFHKLYMLEYSSNKKYWEDVYKFIDD